MRTTLRRITLISCGLLALLLLQPVNSPVAYGDDCCYDYCDCCCDDDNGGDKPGCSKCGQGSEQVTLPRFNGPAWTADMDALLSHSATGKDTINQLRDADGDGIPDHAVYVVLDDDGNIKYVVSFPTENENAEPDTTNFCAPPPPGGECPTWIGVIEPGTLHQHTPGGQQYCCVTENSVLVGAKAACYMVSGACIGGTLVCVLPTNSVPACGRCNN